MTFGEATNHLLEAVQAHDLDALGRALDARAAAIESGFTPTAEMVEAGDRALEELAALKQGLAFDGARLKQLQEGVASSLAAPNPHFDYNG